jgi:hypothetical protein
VKYLIPPAFIVMRVTNLVVTIFLRCWAHLTHIETLRRSMKMQSRNSWLTVNAIRMGLAPVSMLSIVEMKNFDLPQVHVRNFLSYILLSPKTRKRYLPSDVPGWNETHL